MTGDGISGMTSSPSMSVIYYLVDRRGFLLSESRYPFNSSSVRLVIAVRAMSFVANGSLYTFFFVRRFGGFVRCSIVL